MTAATIPAVYWPAHHCNHAEFTLRWGHLHGGEYGWKLRHRGSVIAALVGYPVGAPANTEREARMWADQVIGTPQQWIQKPRRSSAHHTHTDSTTRCASGRKP